jgi:tRNA A37 threonylcarbamoyltransferase TsaD
VAPAVAEERHRENIPKAVDKVLKDYDVKKGDKRLRAIAVTIGPG